MVSRADTDTSGERGQALTLEAVTAGILLLVAVAFALQMTAVTPLSASTSSQHLENQLQKTGEGLLASTDANGSLKAAVLDWNETEEAFDEEGAESFYRAGSPDNAFGDVLDETYGNRSIAYNVVVHYHEPGGGMDRETMVNQGEPSDHAVSASRTVVLDSGDNLTDGTPLYEADDFYADQLGSDGDPVYNVVRVEVIAWRI